MRSPRSPRGATQPACRTSDAPLAIDAASADWPIDRADAVLSINMVHISPWASALGLLAGAARLLDPGAPLILYGPWLKDDIATAPSNLAFRRRSQAPRSSMGLFAGSRISPAAANPHGFTLEDIRRMPANNLMMLWSKT